MTLYYLYLKQNPDQIQFIHAKSPERATILAWKTYPLLPSETGYDTWIVTPLIDHSEKLERVVDCKSNEYWSYIFALGANLLPYNKKE